VIRGLWFFAQLGVLVLGAVWLAEQNGAVSIEWRGWLVETSAGILMLAVLIFAVVLILLLRLWRAISGTPHAIARFRFRRRKARGYVALVRARSAIASGEGALALRHASEAEEIGDPALAHLAAAEAAELAGDTERALAEYEQLRARPDTAVIALRGLIGMKERQGDKAGAMELARAARKLAPKSPWAAHRLFMLERETGAFSEAEDTLADAIKLGAFSESEAGPILAEMLMSRAQSAQAAGNYVQALSDAERAHQLDPASIEAAILGVRLLARSGRIPAAERMLTQSWGLAPDPALAQAWMSLAPPGDVTARLRQAERLYGLNRDAAEGRLTLAEAQLATGRWAEARTQLSGFAVTDNARFCRAMAYLESASGNETAAQDWFERSLRTSGGLPPAAAQAAA
jgi:HemY protein